MKILNPVLATALSALLVGCTSGITPPQVSSRSTQTPDDLYRVDAPEVILNAARGLMESDENVALVTVDHQGQPRVRSVKAFLSEVDPGDPSKAMTVWIMTRDSTRKIEQIHDHPQVTLYFDDDAKLSYLTIMGDAVIHTDPADPRVRPFLIEGYKEFFWPAFPSGFVMIEVKPRWIEFMGPGVKNHRQNWRPQAVVFPQ